MNSHITDAAAHLTALRLNTLDFIIAARNLLRNAEGEDRRRRETGIDIAREVLEQCQSMGMKLQKILDMEKKLWHDIDIERAS